MKRFPLYCTLLAAALLGACKEPSPAPPRTDATENRSTTTRTPETSRESTTSGSEQSLGDIKRSVDNPAAGAIIIGPPVGDKR